MNCETHFQEIRYVCRSDACYYQPLCQSCLEDHRHKGSELLLLSKAEQLASNNLAKQKETIDELLQPFAKRKLLAQKIEEQKKLLRKQRDRLVKYVQDYIEQEVSRLTSENSSTMLSGPEKQLERDLQEKMSEIEELLVNYRRRPVDLQKALGLELQKFMQSLGKSHSNLYGTTHFKYYSSLTHEIMISRLELTAEKTTSRPFRKVMNESPLYFLIDSAFNSSPLLPHFSPTRQDLIVYNVEDQEWAVFHSKEMQICEQGSLVHDAGNSRFFWVGGIQGNRKSGNIVMYSLKEVDKSRRWKQLQLRNPRSSCMTCVVTTNDLTGKPRSGILIVGGVGDNGEVLKSCEYLDLSTLQIYSFGQTNFSTFSGSLLVFNQSTVLRLGGLSKNRNDYSVVEVVEKLDVEEALNCLDREGREPRWCYVELQLPKGEYLAQPRLFYANQSACQLNPNEVFVFGGLDAGMKGVTESYLVGLEEFAPPSREVKDRARNKQQRFSVRWVNEKPLISGDDFSGLKPTVWKQRLYTLQNIGAGEMVGQQKRLLQFDMYQWYQTESVLPQ